MASRCFGWRRVNLSETVEFARFAAAATNARGSTLGRDSAFP
jgi:hypothetical protein